jgi:hypothetical protein
VTRPTERLQVSRIEAALGSGADRLDVVDHLGAAFDLTHEDKGDRAVRTRDEGAEFFPGNVVTTGSSSRARIAFLVAGAPSGETLGRRLSARRVEEAALDCCASRACTLLLYPLGRYGATNENFVLVSR